ncbi:hypothetical protein Dda_9360 [Drechslerella dactyloides]|uniref:Uncharacterized protein n=1 Tax=Drechslerella dactyloides TaxID=74499 RepID=A0AAD6IRV6_DREDA|nr:hypothetical protein Dda_9360 [Drechslerella dactyloides]
MQKSKGRLSSRNGRVEHPTFLLPTPSFETLPSFWESDTDAETEDSAVGSRRSSPRSSSGYLEELNKDGEGSKRHRRSIESVKSEDASNLTASESISRTVTVTGDSKGKKTEKSELDKKQKISEGTGKSEDSNSRLKDSDEEDEDPKTHRKHILRKTLLLKSLKERIKSEHKQKPRSAKHGVSVSSDPLKVYEESINSTDSPRRPIRHSTHMTAEFKLHFWRDRYENPGGHLDRIKESLYRRRIRRLVKLITKLQAALITS